MFLTTFNHVPHCDGKLDEATAGCEDCHIVPALDPDYQKWLDSLSPIQFNRHDWTGETGVIRPINSIQFTIDDIEGVWTMNEGEHEGIVQITDGERVYRGFFHYGKAFFSECGCEREDDDPRIAFAQVMHNI